MSQKFENQLQALSYFLKANLTQHILIHPILCDGTKIAATGYYLHAATGYCYAYFREKRLTAASDMFCPS